jgi:ABC-type branched-subunit amino acid transport system substrate-binding protein
MSRGLRVTSRCAIALVALICLVTAVACDRAGKDPDAAGAPVTTVPCPGEPLRFTTIGSLSGALTVSSVAKDTSDGYQAALHAVNGSCQLGRPLEIEVCDDKSDPNEATRCGRDAAADGTLALFGSSGAFDTGTTAADLPGVLTAGGTVFDLTDPRSFAAISGLTLVVGGVSAAAAVGADDVLMVALDSGPTRSFLGFSTQIASDLGINMDTLWVPPETTDWAPVAAQIAEKDPKAIGLILPSVVPFMNALDAEGISAQDVPIMSAVTLVPPEVVDELGPKGDGMYLLTQAAPPSDTDNPGIAQMLDELEAAGISGDATKRSPGLTTAWSNVHLLADILATVPPAQLETLDSAGVVDVFSKVGPTSRPEYAAFDFTKMAYPDIPALSALRLFSRDAMVVKVEDGSYRSVSPFGDATQPFDLNS